eukprot:7053486-Alexandrium_andersonii.AAC.1
MVRCRSAWNARTANSAEHYQMRVREMSWQKAKNDIDDRYAGESQREFRNRLVEATCAIAETIARDVLAASLEQLSLIHI